MLAGGAVFWAKASSDYDEFRTTTSPQRHDELRDAIPGEETARDVLVGAGLATGALAVVLFFLEGKAAPQQASAGLRVAPGPGPGLSLMGRF
jgi:hypothetical protein